MCIRDRNVVLYLPTVNGFASNAQKDHLKATILNEIKHSCTYNKIEIFQFECNEKNITMTCDGSHGGSIKGICRRQLEPTCDTSLLTNITHSFSGNKTSNPCYLQSYNKTTMTCVCDLCELRSRGLTERRRRRLSGIEDESLKVIALTTFVLRDFVEVNKESHRLGESVTYIDAINVFVLFISLWGLVLFVRLFRERAKSRMDAKQNSRKHLSLQLQITRMMITM